MSTLKLPEIVNISKAAETKSKNFIIHLTKAQWKKTILKSAVYKGKKKFSEVAKNVITFNELEGLDGGLITAYSKDKNGKKIDLFPVVEIKNGEKIIMFRKKKGIGGIISQSDCLAGCVGGSIQCIGNCSTMAGRSCNSIIDPYTNKISACMCLGASQY